jgi:hypothetical protein
MIVSISGKPGGGKSYYAVVQLVSVLLTSTKVIVTNLPLNFDNLVSFLVENYPKFDVSTLATRLYFLGNESVSRFFLFRGDPKICPILIPVVSDKGMILSCDWSKIHDLGVTYFIDECQIYFSSRQWASVGAVVREYLTQHRHFGDDVYFISPDLNQVDKDFRAIAEQYFYLTNRKRMRIGKIFSGPKNHRWSLFYVPPSQGLSAPTESGTFTIDIRKNGLASIYSTAAINSGSIVTGNADTNDKSKRLSIYWIFPIIIICAVLGIYLILHFAHKGVSDGVNHMLNFSNTNVHSQYLKVDDSNSVHTVLEKRKIEKEIEKEKKENRCIGVMTMSGKTTIFCTSEDFPKIVVDSNKAFEVPGGVQYFNPYSQKFELIKYQKVDNDFSGVVSSSVVNENEIQKDLLRYSPHNRPEGQK